MIFKLITKYQERKLEKQMKEAYFCNDCFDLSVQLWWKNITFTEYVEQAQELAVKHEAHVNSVYKFTKEYIKLKNSVFDMLMN